MIIMVVLSMIRSQIAPVRSFTTIASQITRSRSATIPSHHHYHHQQRIPQTQSQHEYSFLYSLPPGDTAANEAVTTTGSSPLEVAITNYFRTQSIANFDDSTSHMYKIRDVFHEPYWIESYRFVFSSEHNILYRPEIVNEIVSKVKENLFNVRDQGLMINGPPGIGKSHSIINTVRKLQSTGNYLVTFLPDCDQWHTSDELVNAICSSFGTNYDLLDLPYFKNGKNAYVSNFMDFIEAVDTVLERSGKQWIFVYDQIDRLFARFRRQMLPFPFHCIKMFMKAGRITSVISASVNYEISYNDEHYRYDDFLQYSHPAAMTKDETQMLFHCTQKIDEVTQMTGNVPFYANEFITTFGEEKDEFNYRRSGSIVDSINKLLELMNPYDKNMLYENMIHMLLLLDFENGAPTVYDRKHFVQIKGRLRFQALFPLAESTWRKHLQNELFEYIKIHESRLLSIHTSSDTTYDTKDRLFELIVIQRCMTHGVANFPLSLVSTNVAPDETVFVPNKQYHFSKDGLPRLTVESYHDGVHIPSKCNFPAIDVIWKTGMYVFGVQIHTSSTDDDVASLFEEQCRVAGWFDTFQDNVFLIYLCPNVSSMIASKPNDTFRQTTESGLKIGYITTADVECLKNM